MWSSRLAPLRRYTRGYTGNKAYAIRPYVYNQSEMKDAIERIQSLNKTPIAGWPLTASQYTQFIRGRLYVLTDNLMTLYDNKKKEDIKQELESILKYCEEYIAFATKRLEEFPTLAPLVWLL